jgi:hypothetical protein
MNGWIDKWIDRQKNDECKTLDGWTDRQMIEGKDKQKYIQSEE